MPRVWNTKSGAAFASKLEVSESTYRALFSQSGWNDIVRAGIYSAGQYFVTVDLPKRFTNYAREALGYRGKNKNPLLETGRLRNFLLPKAYPEARSTSSNVSLTIRMPVPAMITHGKLRHLFNKAVDRNYYANPTVNKVLKTITSAELTKMSEVMAETIQGLISGATTKTNRNGRTSMDLTGSQRSSISHATKSQKSLAQLHQSSHRVH